jgi:hypothetical protein
VVVIGAGPVGLAAAAHLLDRGMELAQPAITFVCTQRLTPCMPSRDPHHGAHHETPRSRVLHQSSTAGEWWFVRVRRAELLLGCCAE